MESSTQHEHVIANLASWVHYVTEHQNVVVGLSMFSIYHISFVKTVPAPNLIQPVHALIPFHLFGAEPNENKNIYRTLSALHQNAFKNHGRKVGFVTD